MAYLYRLLLLPSLFLLVKYSDVRISLVGLRSWFDRSIPLFSRKKKWLQIITLMYNNRQLTDIVTFLKTSSSSRKQNNDSVCYYRKCHGWGGGEQGRKIDYQEAHAPPAPSEYRHFAQRHVMKIIQRSSDGADA